MIDAKSPFHQQLGPAGRGSTWCYCLHRSPPPHRPRPQSYGDQMHSSSRHPSHLLIELWRTASPIRKLRWVASRMRGRLPIPYCTGWTGTSESDTSQTTWVRSFPPQSPPLRVPDRNSRVRYISEEVTVRYFPPEPAVAQPLTRSASPAQSVSR